MQRIAVFAVALAAIAASTFSGSARADEKKWTEVRIGTEGAFRPWNYTNPDGSLGGFEIDLINILCPRMHVTCTVSAQPFDSLIPSLNAGKFDAIIAGMSATPKRQEVIAFTQSYGTTGQGFATLKGSPLAGLPDQGQVFSLSSDEAGTEKEIDKLKPLLKDKVIGVQTASIAEAFLNKYFKDTLQIRSYKTTEQHDLDLEAGRVDLVIASVAYLSDAAAKPQNSEMTLVGPRFQGGLLGRGSAVGLRKDDTELKAMFDKAIDEAKADGTIKNLSMKYFGFDVTPR